MRECEGEERGLAEEGRGETESEKEDKETKNGLLGSNLLDKEAHHRATNESFLGQPERQRRSETRRDNRNTTIPHMLEIMKRLET